MVLYEILRYLGAPLWKISFSYSSRTSETMKLMFTTCENTLQEAKIRDFSLKIWFCLKFLPISVRRQRNIEPATRVFFGV